MNSRLLWYDNSKRPIADKIADAAKRYKQKFGCVPNIVFINPRDCLASIVNVPSTMKVHAKTTILPDHIWLGVKSQ